ncbi:MAG: formyltransferase family protein, partial [Acidobacteriota bacterium]
MSRPRLAILLSGRGSNFLALHRAVEAGQINADIALVLSNIDGAPGLDRARELGLATRSLPHRRLKRARHEELVIEALREAEIDWVCLAGYMRLLGGDFVDAYRHRIVNIH